MSSYQNELPGDSRSRAAGCLLPLLLGLIVGPMAAGAAAVVAWRAIPVEYRATAWLRIAPAKSSVMFKVSGDEDVLNQPQAHQFLITSRFVLEAALRRPGVDKLECLRNQEDRLEWMRNHLDVSFPGNSEILQIAMTGEDPSELATLVNAVTNAYMEEVVGVDRENHRRRKDLLEASYKRNLGQVAKKSDRLRELGRELGVPDPELAKARLTRDVDALAQLRLRQTNIEIDFCGAEERVRILKERCAARAAKPAAPNDKPDAKKAPATEDGAPADAATAALEAAMLERSVLAAMLGELTRSVRKAEADLKQGAESATELAQRRAELERLKQITERMGSELDQWEMELAGPGRVSVLAPATPPKTGNLRVKLRMVVIAACAAFGVAFVLGAGAVLIVRSLTAWASRT